MATRQVITQQLKRILNHHQGYNLTSEMLDDYVSALEVCLPEELIAGVTHLISTSKWFPKPSEILEAHENVIKSKLAVKYGERINWIIDIPRTTDQDDPRRYLEGEYGKVGVH